jgi:hypothetical protein
MRKTLVIFAILAAVLAAVLIGAPKGTREISRADLRDKIEGGWAGQIIGVSYGAPTEYKFIQKIIEEDLPRWTPDRVAECLKQDDLYVDMTFAKVLDDKGLDATSEDFGAMFRNSKYPLWHANAAGRRNLRRGIPAALAGSPKYNTHANDIDFQIEADFVGVMCPGLPRASNQICDRAGRVVNYGDGLYGGMFVSGMYAAAYFENDPRKIVEAGLACIPARSPYGRLIADVLAWSKQYPNDWKKVWHLIQDKWDKRDACPSGALQPFSIDASLNGAYIALGLLYGGGDFFRTIDISTRSGQDSDCNPASAGGILGVMMGYRKIPDEWKSGIPKIADEKFQFTDYSFRTIVDSTEKRALELVKKTGGAVKGDQVIVKVQAPEAPKLELWDDYGSPLERVRADDARWSFQGTWKSSIQRWVGGLKLPLMISGEKGAEAVISFEGTGAYIIGRMLASGGKAEVYVDGKLHEKVDSYSYDDKGYGQMTLWHGFKLKDGKHTVRVVVLGESIPASTVGGDAIPASSGSDVAISELVTFR